MTRAIRAAFAVMALSVAGGVAAENFRCGNSIVNESQTPAEIRAKCGAPDSTTSTTSDVYGPSDAGGGTIKRGTTTTETWIYKRGSGAADMVVTIVDGKVRSVERARK